MFKMIQNEHSNEQLTPDLNLQASSHIINDMTKVPNVVLQRLIEEVQYENKSNISAYNRTHNRHNRGR